MKTIVRRPNLHYVIMAAYVLAPVANVALVHLFGNVPVSQILQRLVRGYGGAATAWLLTAPLVGLSLFLVNRFTWYLFIGHSSLILVDFVYKWIDRPRFYLETVAGALNMLLLIGNLALVGVVLYIVQRDFRSPYFQVLMRSFRESHRIPIEHFVDVGGRRARITDLSVGGCFVAEPDVPLPDQGTVRLGLSAGNVDILCDARVMRRTTEGYGLMFVGLSPGERRSLRQFVAQRYQLRYRVLLPAVYRCLSEDRTVEVRDISAGGCYVAVDAAWLADVVVGDSTHLTLSVDNHEYKLHGRVAWTNPEGGFGKPPGFGVAYMRRRRSIMRRLVDRDGRRQLVR